MSTTAETNGRSTLKTLDDLEAAMQEVVGGKCDRCHQEAATLTMRATLKPPHPGGRTGSMKPKAEIKANICEACGVQMLSVLGRAVGKVKA